MGSGPFFLYSGIHVANVSVSSEALLALNCTKVQHGVSRGSPYAIMDCAFSLGMALRLTEAEELAEASMLEPRGGVFNLSEVDHECVVVHDFNTSASTFARFFGRAAPA